MMWISEGCNLFIKIIVKYLFYYYSFLGKIKIKGIEANASTAQI